jgi:PAS domain S-box-containing protein
MPDASVPDLENVDERQAALRRYHVLDTPPEKDFDRITSLVAKVCEVPTALITLIDKERQWFKSCFGLGADIRETDIEHSFCVYAVDKRDVLVVEDATEDPRFKDNPFVTGPPHFRFYAGAPLRTPDGIHIGTLCILDDEPRVFDAADLEILESLADLVVAQFEYRSSEAQIRQMVDQNPRPMMVFAQSDGRHLRSNPAARRLYGYDEGEMAGLHRSALRAAAGDAGEDARHVLHERTDGSLVPVVLETREILFDGVPATLVAPSEARVRSPDARFFLLGGNGRIHLLDEQDEEMGLTTTTDEPATLPDLIDTAEQSDLAEQLEALRSGTRARHAEQVLLSGGAGGPQAADLVVRPLKNPQRDVTALVGMLLPLSSTPPAGASPSSGPAAGREARPGGAGRPDRPAPGPNGQDGGARAPAGEEASSDEDSDILERARTMFEDLDDFGAAGDGAE